MSLILPLAQVSSTQTEIAGTKATALSTLWRAGFTVPNGFVLTTHAYRLLIAELRDRIHARLTPETITDPTEIEAAAAEIRAWIENAHWSSALREQLELALAACASDDSLTSYAVRTSMPTDDLATAFGSGVKRAYLGLTTADEVARAAAQCWAGLWNSRAMYYRYRKKIVQTEVTLAVLVQPLIHAESAGVMFTQNPTSSGREEIEIHSIWGLGAPLTGARIAPDRFYVTKPTLEIAARKVAEKPIQLRVVEGKTEEQSVDALLSHAPSLTDEQVIELARLGMRIQDLFRVPQQIEWAHAGNTFYILQSRPIGVAPRA